MRLIRDERRNLRVSIAIISCDFCRSQEEMTPGAPSQPGWCSIGGPFTDADGHVHGPNKDMCPHCLKRLK